MKYRADIDGLRAIAVIPVVLFHSGVPFFSGGYVGVDVFFVISGYVIGSRLVEEIEADRYSVLTFYERRIRRIFPALFLMISLSYLAALILMLPDQMMDFSRGVAATAVFISNIFFWRNSGYFAAAALDKPLLHTWSLSIEEQFYILIPVVLSFSLKLGRSWAFWLFALGASISFSLCCYFTERAATADFFLLPTRAWELLLGVLIVLRSPFRIKTRLAKEFLAICGILLIALAVVSYSDLTPFPGFSTLLPCAGAAIVIIAGAGQYPTFVENILGSRPINQIGLMSYSLYLAHWPVIVFFRYALLRNITGWLIVVVITTSLALGYLSWRYVELPFRSGSRRQPRWVVFGASACLLTTIASLGLLGVASSGFPSRYPNFLLLPSSDKLLQDVWLRGSCFLEGDQKPTDWKGDICIRTHGNKPNALLWGDSFAAHYMPGLIKNQDGLSHNIVQYNFAGCPPIISYRSFATGHSCSDFNSQVLDVIHKYKIDAVVISSRWDLYKRLDASGLPDTIDLLKRNGMKVYVIGQSPMYDFAIDILNFRGAGILREDGNLAWYLSFDPTENNRIKRASTSANFVDPLPTFCEGRLCDYKSDKGYLFNDYGHFSELGSDLAVISYFPLFGSRPISPSANGQSRLPINSEKIE
jgi:peptidoglycan/LPS O-acetylase OafA/YrhL